VHQSHGGQTTTALSIYQSHLGLPGNVYLARVDVRSVAPDLGGLDYLPVGTRLLQLTSCVLFAKKTDAKRVPYGDGTRTIAIGSAQSLLASCVIQITCVSAIFMLACQLRLRKKNG